MKKSIKLSVFLLLFIASIQSYAIVIDQKKENLVVKMSESKNVKLFIQNRVNCVLNSFATSIAATPVDEKFFKIQSEKMFFDSLENRIKVEAEFPELVTMSPNEKTEIFKRVLETESIAFSIKSAVKCVGISVLGFTTCMWGSLLTYQVWTWAGCFAAGIAADIVFVCASDGLGFAELATELKLEAKFCWQLAKQKTATTLTGVETNCVTGFTAGYPICLALI